MAVVPCAGSSTEGSARGWQPWVPPEAAEPPLPPGACIQRTYIQMSSCQLKEEENILFELDEI